MIPEARKNRSHWSQRTGENPVPAQHADTKGLKQRSSSRQISQKPSKKIAFHTGIKRRVMMFKFMTEAEEVVKVHGQEADWRKNTTNWKKRLLSFIKEVYPEVKTRQFETWVKNNTWIMLYKGHPPHGTFDLKTYNKAREEFFMGEEESSTCDDSDSEKSHVSMDDEDLTESEISTEVEAHEPSPRPGLVSGSCDIATDNPNGDRRVSDDQDRQQGDQVGQANLTIHDGSNPEGRACNNEDQGHGGEGFTTEAETITLSSELGFSFGVTATKVPCSIKESNVRSGILPINTGSLPRHDSERPSTSAKSRKRLERPHQGPAPLCIKKQRSDVQNSRETQEPVEPVLPARTELSDPLTFDQLVNRIGTDTELGRDLMNSIRSLLTVDCPSNFRISGKLSHTATIIRIGGSFSARTITGPSFLNPDEREIDFMIRVGDMYICTLQSPQRCQHSLNFSTSVGSNQRGEQMGNSVPPPLPDNTFVRGQIANLLGLPTAPLLTSVTNIPVAAFSPQPVSFRSIQAESNILVSQNGHPAKPAQGNVSKTPTRPTIQGSENPENFPRRKKHFAVAPNVAHGSTQTPRAASIGTCPNFQSSPGSNRSRSRNDQADSGSQMEVRGKDGIPLDGVPPHGVPADLERPHMTQKSVEEFKWIYRSFASVQELNILFGLLGNSESLQSPLQSMYELMCAEHRRIILPNTVQQRKIEVISLVDDEDE